LPLALIFAGIAFTLTLLVRSAVPNVFLSQDRPLNCPGPFDSLRNGSLTNDFTNRPRRECSASSLRDDLHARSLVHNDSFAPATEVTILAAKVVNHAGAIDDCSVVYDDGIGTNSIVETMNVHENK